MELSYEIIGYLGSVLIALSLSMKNIRLIRKINLFGALSFSVYGLFIGALPVFALNGYIALIDVYYLYKMYRTKEDFKMVPVLDKKHNYLNLFLDYYLDDILKYFPKFDRGEINNFDCFFILRDLRIIGLLIFEKISNTEIKVHLDYVIKDYRDLKSGKFLYNSEIKHFKKLGFETILTESDVKEHIKYLLNVGFEKLTGNNLIYTRKI